MAVATITYLCRECHRISRDRGWYDEGERNFGELIALVHSELSEALEAYRDGDPPDKHLPHLSSVQVELADTLIRVFDLAEYLDIDLEMAVIDKMEFNKTREYRHGGKRF